MRISQKNLQLSISQLTKSIENIKSLTIELFIIDNQLRFEFCLKNNDANEDNNDNNDTDKMCAHPST